MKLHTRRFSALAFAALLFASCQKDNSIGNGSGVSMQLKAKNTSALLQSMQPGANGPSQRIEGVNIEWTSGKASANLLKFEAEKDGSEVEFKSKVKRTIDLFAANNAFGTINIPAGTYNEIEFKAQLSVDGAAPALELKGQLQSSGVATNIVFQANEAIEIKGEKHNVTITDNTVHTAVTAMDLTKIMQGISASALDNAVRTNGEIIISSNVNANLYATIVKNLRNLEDEEEFH